MNSSFASRVPLRASSQKLLLKRTTAGRRILSTASLTFFEVYLSMIVLPAAQVLHQSSAGTAPRAATKASAATNNVLQDVPDMLSTDFSHNFAHLAREALHALGDHVEHVSAASAARWDAKKHS